MSDVVKIGLVSISDAGLGRIYEDKGIPALQDWPEYQALHHPVGAGDAPDRRRPADHRGDADQAVDVAGCHLVLTTGGTGPALRDVTRKPPGRRPQGDAGLWRADASGRPGFRAYRDPVHGVYGDPRQQPHHQPAGNGQGDHRNPGRAEGRRRQPRRCTASLRRCPVFVGDHRRKRTSGPRRWW